MLARILIVVLGLTISLTYPSGSRAEADIGGTGLSGQDMLAIASQYFTEPELNTTSQGIPYIIATSRGTVFAIVGSSCRGGYCGVYGFYTFWEGSYSLPQKMNALNAYHASNRFGKGYIDNESKLSFDWYIGVAGSTRTHVAALCIVWRDAVLPGFMSNVALLPSGASESVSDATASAVDMETADGQKEGVAATLGTSALGGLQLTDADLEEIRQKSVNRLE